MTPETISPPNDSNGDILHPGSRALFRYWESVRGENSAPARSDLDLARIKEYLPWVFVLDRDPQKQAYSWRLAGTKICELWRRNLTGENFFTGWKTFERESAARLLDHVTAEHQPVVLRFRLRSSLGNVIGAELLGLPAVKRDGTETQVFGSIMPFRDIDGLGYDHLTGLELSGARVIWTEKTLAGHADALLGSIHGRPFGTFQVIEGGLSGPS